jgi:hypothetical protein
MRILNKTVFPSLGHSWCAFVCFLAALLPRAKIHKSASKGWWSSHPACVHLLENHAPPSSINIETKESLIATPLDGRKKNP